ncbi:MAG: NAD(P)H-hydrate dehydratase [Xanthomonadaceae bacterium]|nr:NAD(P)H-hydrate dehydratase [Xanthomonadaceae bacterium]
MRIFTREEIRLIDEKSQSQYGINPEILMEIAGARAVEVFLKYRPDAGKSKPVIILAGLGNNGGDAMVIARHLAGISRRTHVFLTGDSSKLKSPNSSHYNVLKNINVPVTEISHISTLCTFFDQDPGHYDIIDGLLGTGMSGGTSGLYADVIELTQKHAGFVFSLDIPSGVDANTGAVAGTSFQADITASFGFPKLGHFFSPGAQLRGKLINLELSYPVELSQDSAIKLLREKDVRPLIKHRDPYGHKNSFGHTLLIGGTPGRVGAITLSSKACHRTGSGLVTAATWAESWQPLMAHVSDETMTIGIEDINKITADPHALLSPFNAVVLGPGLGTDSRAKKLLESILETYQGPLVIDADAINLISMHGFHGRVKSRQAPCILTPHPGEMSRLLKVDKDKILLSPIGAIHQAIELTHATVVLKGAVTLIGGVDEPVYLSHYPNAGMATAGSGDVLAGILGALSAQGYTAHHSALLGVYLHSLAGDLAAQAHPHGSMMAGNIIEKIGHAFEKIHESKNNRVSTLFTAIR